tara:strand:- start:406 stop:672 length:267 start_codon:yes stop_codon:yes gene_type:complete
MAVVATVYDSTCKVCDVVRYQLFRVFNHIQRSKQLSANMAIFADIQNVDKDAGYHLANMNDATNKKYNERLKNFKKYSVWGWENPTDD